MKKMRAMAFILLFTMIFNVIPIQVFANAVESEQQNEELVKEQLRMAVDETEYPNGLFDFLTTRMNTSESLSSVEFAVVRKGGTAGRASITLKAIDVSAKYGEDYTLSVPKGIFSQTLQENEDAKPLIDSIASSENSPTVTVTDEVYAEEAYSSIGDSRDTTVTDEVYSGSGAAVEYEELPAPQKVEQAIPGGLRGAREAFIGMESDRKDWREADRETKESALEQQKELYEGVPGVTYTFNFEDGEYIKKIRFNTIDDKISEDDEQVLFVLLDPAGGVLGDSLNGFMNIKDNEELENVEFEIAEDKLSVNRSAGYAEVTVRRTKGLYRYGMISIGTAAITAEPNVDYEPVMTELRFVPGQEVQKYRVPLLEGYSEDELKFMIKLDPESTNLSQEGNKNTIVTIEAPVRYLMKSQALPPRFEALSAANPDTGTVKALASSGGYEMIDGKTYRVVKLDTHDIRGDYYALPYEDNTPFPNTYNGGKAWAQMHTTWLNGDQWIYFTEDLTMVERISVDWENNSKGTPYWPFGWIDPLYDTTFYSYFRMGSVGGDPVIQHDGTFGRKWETYNVAPEWQKPASFYFHSRTRGDICRNSNLVVFGVKLYYKPVKVMLGNAREDENEKDCKITPQTWTSANASENTNKENASVYIGTLAFENDPSATVKTFHDIDTVHFAPKFSGDLDSETRSKVYLWGYKIERTGGLTGGSYYYVKGDTLSISTIYSGKMKDVNGKIIPRDEVLLESDTPGEKDTIVVYPVYKPKNAFVKINFDPKKGGMAQNSFANGQVIKVGMLDTVKLNAYAHKGIYVEGYDCRDTSPFGAVTKDSDERLLDQKEASYGIDMISTYSGQLTSVQGVVVNAAVPNELNFKPQNTFSNLKVEFSDGAPYLTVKMDEDCDYPEKGDIMYIPEEGELAEAVDAEAWPEAEEQAGGAPVGGAPVGGAPVMGDKDNVLKISPVVRNKVYTIIGNPDPGYGIIWKDFTGDTDFNGTVDDAEDAALGKYNHLFNGNPVAGKFFSYVANYDRPIIYYSVVDRPANVNPKTVGATVTLKTRNILANTASGGNKDLVKPLSGVSITVNGHNTVTNSEGKFEITHTDFKSNELQTIIIDYKGFKYTGYIQTGRFGTITIEEYDNFIPYNFKILEGTEEVEPEQITNKDSIFKFRFDVKSMKPGLSAEKAIVRIYSKEGIQRGSGIEVVPASGTFSFDFNPAAFGVAPGDTMTVQLVDQSGDAYLEHNVGLMFLKHLDSFALLKSFKSPVSGLLDMVGSLDVAFDMGLAGKVDKYIDKDKKDKEWIITFGFQKNWEKSLYDSSDVSDDKSGKSASEMLKDAAKSTDISKTKDTSGKAIDTGNKEKKSASLTADMKFDLSTSLYLSMKLDSSGKYYFNEMIMTATVSGQFGTKVEIVTPIGVTVFVKLELSSDITAMMVFEKYSSKKVYFDEQGAIDFTNAGTTGVNRDFTAYGKFSVNPAILISVGASISGAAEFAIEGSARFNMDFTTSGSSSGRVTLGSKMMLKILGFINFEWEIANKSWDLFSSGQSRRVNANMFFAGKNYLYDSAENYNVMSREYLENRSEWQGNDTPVYRSYGLMNSLAVGDNARNEQTLLEGVYPYPYTLLAPIGEGEQLLVFLDDDTEQDDRNRTQLYFSINDGRSWSQPQKVDNDNTPDDSPWIYDMGDRVFVAWSSAVKQVSDTDTVMQTLNSRDIKGRFFDKGSGEFGEVQNVTYETAGDTYSDSDPSIAYWKDEKTGKENLMIMYTKTQYQATASEDDKDAVVGDIVNAYSLLAYRFYDFEKNQWDTSMDKGDGWYGQGFIDATRYAKVDESNLLITEDEDYSWAGYWKREPEASEISIELLASDPMIVDSNAIGYDNYAVLAYSIDMDKNIKTTHDRELFIQLYSFEYKTFYPIVHFDDTEGQLDLEFVQADDNVYLYFISDGDIVRIDIGTLFTEKYRNFLYYIIDGKDVFVLNKFKDFYKKPEVAVRHKYEIRKDEEGNEQRINEELIDELMVKANEDNVYVVWGESGISYKDGIDPNSEEAMIPENYYRENHIHAAREIFGEVTEQKLYDENGDVLTYPERDGSDNLIDYDTVLDINNETGIVKAGDPVILKSREAVWTEPVQLTNEKGANFNDLDFVILPDGSLRVVFVKGMSELTEVAGEMMPAENINSRTLMTADFDVNIGKADVEMQPLEMPMAKEMVPVGIKVENKALNTLKNLTVELNQITGDVTENTGSMPLELRGGESLNLSINWQAPENIENTKLQVLVKDGEKVLCSDEQEITAEGIIDVIEANAEFVGRNKLRVTGIAVNNGNIPEVNAEIFANVSGKTVGKVSNGSLGLGEAEDFEFYAEIEPGMFVDTVNSDGSVTSAMTLNVHSDGVPVSIDSQRYASKEDIDIVNNIKTFEIKAGGKQVSNSISMVQGGTMNIIPEITYMDDTMQTVRMVYVSDNEDIAYFGRGGNTLYGKKAGTAAINVYALPENSDMVLSRDGFEMLDNLTTLPDAAVQVRSFTVNVYSNMTDNDDDDRASGSGAGTPAAPASPTTPAGSESIIAVKAAVDSNGKAMTAVTSSQISNAIIKANEKAAGIEIKVEAPQDARTVEASMPASAMREISNSKVGLMTIATPIASITFDDKALDGIAGQASDAVKITASRLEDSALTEEAKKLVGDRPVFNFSITSGDKTISQLGGNVTVSVHYTPKAGEDTNSIVIYYIDANGVPQIVSNCAYNAETGTLTFKTNHFSQFAVGYNKVTFKDVAVDAWYRDAVGFAAARGITEGTGNGNFSPGTKLTRAQFLVMMMRAYGISPDENPEDNFADAGKTYYTGYLAAAKRLGITKGTGSNMYAPDNEITRQEMFTLLYNALRLLNELPKGKEGKPLAAFSDAEQVAPWAMDAMSLFTLTGTMRGSDGRLSPEDTGTRAQMAQILYNLMLK